MAASASIRMPLEVLSLIFESIIAIDFEDSQDRDDEEQFFKEEAQLVALFPNYKARHALVACAMTCREWLKPARQYLYQNIKLKPGDHFTLLHTTLVYLNPSLGKYVCMLWGTEDTEAILRSLSAILENTPRLTGLQVPYNLWRMINDNTDEVQNKKLRNLTLRSTEEWCLEGPAFTVPSGLQSLTVISLAYGHAVSNWAIGEEALSDLKRLCFEWSAYYDEYEEYEDEESEAIALPINPKTQCSLPPMPKLSYLTICGMRSEARYYTEHSAYDPNRKLSNLLHLVMGACPRNLRSLKLTSVAEVDDTIFISVLDTLANANIRLEHFTYHTAPHQCKHSNADGIDWHKFPRTLQSIRLESTLSYVSKDVHSCGITVAFLQACQLQEFLPRLTSCPEVQWTFTQAVLRYVSMSKAWQESAYPLAKAAAMALSLRPGLDPFERGRKAMPKGIMQILPLPFPVERSQMPIKTINKSHASTSSQQ